MLLKVLISHWGYPFKVPLSCTPTKLATCRLVNALNSGIWALEFYSFLLPVILLGLGAESLGHMTVLVLIF